MAVMRGRVLFGLALGVAGICLGVTGIIFSASLLTVLAALCAVCACFVVGGAALLPLLQGADTAEQMNIRIDAVTAPVAMSSQHAETEPSDDESVIDPLTDFPDGRYFEVAVESRVAAARRHLWPVSIILIQLGFDNSRYQNQGRHNESVATFARLMRQTLREADIACRLDQNTFGLILEDTSEEGGVWTAERLQIALSQDTTSIRSLVAGVAAYPTHGLFAGDVLTRARAALARASATPTDHGLGQVEVAHVDLS